LLPETHLTLANALLARGETAKAKHHYQAAAAAQPPFLAQRQLIDNAVRHLEAHGRQQP
jgi:hypothetical protein